MAEAVEITDPAAAVSNENGDRGVILVVEDDPMVRRLVVERPNQLGYHAVETTDGPSAGRNREERRRSIKILFAPCYDQCAIVSRGPIEPAAEMLMKPYRKADLARGVRAAFGAA